tara:strand:+ start:1738 stop:2127 length:390 start_codon:yes stop_codon:yes gene_type:complete
MSEMNIINIRHEISDDLIESLLCCAFEGGITYWANNVICEDKEDMKKVGGWKHEYLTKTKKKDAVMFIHDIDGGRARITKKQIIDALQEMDFKENGCTKALQRILSGNYDSDDADLMVQMACFGKVIYG